MLFSYLRILLQEDQTHLWQTTRLFDGINRITEDPQEHRRISPLLAEFDFAVGVAHDCKAIIEAHRPASTRRTYKKASPVSRNGIP
jgi:hypothetical protein